MSIHPRRPYGTAKDFCPVSQIAPQTPRPRLWLNSFFTSCVKFDIFSVSPPPPRTLSGWTLCLVQQCCYTVLFYSGRQLSLRRPNRAALHDNLPLPLNQSILPITHNMAHTPLSTHTDTQTQIKTHTFSIIPLKTLRAKVHHTLCFHHCRAWGQNLSISPTTDDSIRNKPPIKSRAYAPPSPLFTSPRQPSESFLLTNHTLKTLEVFKRG